MLMSRLLRDWPAPVVPDGSVQAAVRIAHRDLHRVPGSGTGKANKVVSRAYSIMSCPSVSESNRSSVLIWKLSWREGSAPTSRLAHRPLTTTRGAESAHSLTLSPMLVYNSREFFPERRRRGAAHEGDQRREQSHTQSGPDRHLHERNDRTDSSYLLSMRGSVRWNRTAPRGSSACRQRLSVTNLKFR